MIHGHHIVQKSGGGDDAQAARELLRLLDIPLLGTKSDLMAAKADDLHNMAIAVNKGWRNIHSPEYDRAVLERLTDAAGSLENLRKLRKGSAKWKNAQADAKEALAKMREIMERGDIFWDEFAKVR